MNNRILRPATLSLTLLFAAATISSAEDKSSPAKEPASASSPATTLAQPAEAQLATVQAAETKAAQPSAEEMKKMMAQMMELAKLSENHKLLAGMAGSWTYTVKMWMDPDPNAKPQESKGTSVTKSIMDGRFFVTDVIGTMQMPGADGKPKSMTFKGMGIDGYDNVKKKFVNTWCDNMGTGVMMSEGDYDAATKTFTYTGEYEMMPGMKQKIREVVKMTDKDHHLFEWYEDRGGKEAKTMEISYTRGKK
jgi:hypothetical protein